MIDAPATAGPASDDPPVANYEPLVEYRTAHYAADSEAASYYSNHPARVRFRFDHPIIWQLRRGEKTVRVDAGTPVVVRPGDAMYVPPRAALDIDLSTASRTAPIECDCVEVETRHFEAVVARLNERWASGGQTLSARLDWSQHVVLRQLEAASLELTDLMGLFRAPIDVFTEMRIGARLDATILRLLQLRRQELLAIEAAGHDDGLMAAVRLIQTRLAERIPAADLAKAACMSESTLFRHFRHEFGTTPAEYALRLRLTAAKSALRRSTESVDAIAHRLGFADNSHFARSFRRSTGESPTAYRQRHHRSRRHANRQYESEA